MSYLYYFDTNILFDPNEYKECPAVPQIFSNEDFHSYARDGRSVDEHKLLTRIDPHIELMQEVGSEDTFSIAHA